MVCMDKILSHLGSECKIIMRFYVIDYKILIIWRKYLTRELSGEILKSHLAAKIHSIPPISQAFLSYIHQATLDLGSLLFVQISLYLILDSFLALHAKFSFKNLSVYLRLS